MALAYYKECFECGSFYRPSIKRQKYCCKQCQRKANNKPKSKKRKKNSMNLLTKEAVAAHKLGLTYGQYKAQQWCRNHQNTSYFTQGV